MSRAQAAAAAQKTATKEVDRSKDVELGIPEVNKVRCIWSDAVLVSMAASLAWGSRSGVLELAQPSAVA